MFYVYILKSAKNGKYYIGSTKDLSGRLRAHNSGKVRSTKNLTPMDIVHFEDYSANIEARRREIEIKRKKSIRYIESLFKSAES